MRVEIPDRFFQRSGINAELPGEAGDAVRLVRREHGRHEQVDGLGIYDDIGDLPGLLGYEATPDGVALGPDFLAFIVKTLAVSVNGNAERHAVETRADAAIKFGGTAVNCHTVSLRGIAEGFGSVVHHDLKHAALVIRRSADEEVGSFRAPRAGQPFGIGLIAAGSQHYSLGLHDKRGALLIHLGRFELAVPDFQIRHFSVIEHFDAELLRGSVISVDERLASSEEEGVGAGKVKRAAHGGLKMDALFHHPIPDVIGVPDNQAGHGFYGIPLGHAHQVVETFLFRVRPCQKVILGSVNITDIARVAAVASAEFLR